MAEPEPPRAHQPGSWDEMPERDYAEGDVRWHEMPNLRQSFLSGHNFALMLAVYKCAQRGQPLPSWVARAFSEGFGRVYRGEARSWNDVFGTANAGKHLANIEPRRALMLAVCERMRHRKIDDPAVGVGLFDVIAKELNTTRKIVSELYYEGRAINSPKETDGDFILNMLSDPDPLLDQDDPVLPKFFLSKSEK